MCFGLINPSQHQGYSHGGVGKTKLSQHMQSTNKEHCLLALNKYCCYVDLFLLCLWVKSIIFCNTNHKNNDILLFYLKLHSVSSHLWTHSTNQPIRLYDAAGTFITLVTETYKSKENMVCIFMELSRHLPYSELSLIQRGLKPRQLYFVQMNKMYIVVVRTRPIFTQSWFNWCN